MSHLPPSSETATKPRFAVLGAGAWGTALSQALSFAGHEVILWAREEEVVRSIADKGENTLFLPNIALSDMIVPTMQMSDLAQIDIVLAVCPAQHMRTTLSELSSYVRPNINIILCAKGVERGTDHLMNEVCGQTLPQAKISVMAGPSFAHEVALNKPCAVTLASQDLQEGERLAALIASPNFRPYVSDDLVAAEAGGAIKNVLAIACGIAEGRKLGRNAHAALLTRGFAEMTRLAVAMGGRAESMMGLCGLGDLVLTCSSIQSRNMSTGVSLGLGLSLNQHMEGKLTVAEGVQSAPAVVKLGQKYGVDLPICRAVNGVLTGSLSVDQAIEALLSRPLRADGI